MNLEAFTTVLLLRKVLKKQGNNLRKISSHLWHILKYKCTYIHVHAYIYPQNTNTHTHTHTHSLIHMLGWTISVSLFFKKLRFYLFIYFTFIFLATENGMWDLCSRIPCNERTFLTTAPPRKSLPAPQPLYIYTHTHTYTYTYAYAYVFEGII